MCAFQSCAMQQHMYKSWEKEEMACCGVKMVLHFSRYVKEKEAGERYLSRMNSAISFCICFPFSCFCSRTSNPVMQLLLWASLLSFCNVSNKSLSQKRQTYWCWSLIREKSGLYLHLSLLDLYLSCFVLLINIFHFWEMHNTRNIICNKVFFMSLYGTYSVATIMNHANPWAYCVPSWLCGVFFFIPKASISQVFCLQRLCTSLLISPCYGSSCLPKAELKPSYINSGLRMYVWVLLHVSMGLTAKGKADHSFLWKIHFCYFFGVLIGTWNRYIHLTDGEHFDCEGVGLSVTGV